MSERLLLVVAHPDDESFGCGALLAGAVARGADAVVCCATRGEAGVDRTGAITDRAKLARVREGELRAAARELGVSSVELLGFGDSGWDGEPPPGSLVATPVEEVTGAVGDVLRRYRPTAVVTTDPSGSDGHRDHARIGVATTSAYEQHVDWPARLYHWCLPRSLMQRWSDFQRASNPGSVYVEVELGRPDADITTVVDGTAVLDRAHAAIACHTSQASPFDGLDDDLTRAFVAYDHLLRVVPPWSGGPLETSIFATPAG